MPIAIDGAAILAAMAKDPEAFGFSRPQLDAIAENAVVAKLREKTLGLDGLLRVARGVGAADFRKIVGNLTDKDAKALAKIDGKHPDLKTADANWVRAHLIKLGQGEVGLYAPPPRPPRPPRAPAGRPRAKTPKIGAIMGSEALAAGNEKKNKGSRKPKSTS